MAEEEEWTEVTVDANGNVWAGDELVVFENSGNIKSVGPPPSGITKGELATVDKSGNYSFSQDGLASDPKQFGMGSMVDAGGDLETVLGIWDKIRGIDWKGTFANIGKGLVSAAPSLIAIWSARNDPVAKAQAEALGSQAEASDLMVKAWQKDRDQSEEARLSLYNALQDRIGQGAPPALMPGKVAYANPYQNVVKIGRGESGSGSPESGPGATLRDAIRSQFTDRHPNAPAQHFVQQHPDRNARPGGPSTWEGQAPTPGPFHDQSGRIGVESNKPYGAGNFDDWFKGAGANVDQSERIGTESADPYNTRVQDSGGQAGGQSGRGRGRDRWNTQPPTGTPRDPSYEATLAEAVRAPQQRNLPDPTPDEWMRLLENPHLMEMFKTKGVIL